VKNIEIEFIGMNDPYPKLGIFVGVGVGHITQGFGNARVTNQLNQSGFIQPTQLLDC
jgi:hypothetical protein